MYSKVATDLVLIFSLFFQITTALPHVSSESSPLQRRLNPSCKPGGNFDLSSFKLELPTGAQGSPSSIPGSSLSGCSNGYEDFNTFFTESGDGALVMKVCGSPSSCGCVTSPNSQHCRTELRETSPSSWSPWDSTNRMSVTLSVPVPGSLTCIGQVHQADGVTALNKPVAELFYSNSGDVTLGVEQTREGGDEKTLSVGHVPVGSIFTYTIAYEKNVLSVSLNGGDEKVFSTYSLNAPPSYFKVGNYNQGSSRSSVHLFSIKISH